MFSPLNVDSRLAVLSSGHYVQEGLCTRVLKTGTLNSGYFCAHGLSSVKTIADRHRHAAYYDKH